jgi:NADH-quinone oxidoreductase subunit E
MKKATENGRKSLSPIIEAYRDKPGALLGILEEAQRAEPHRYLSEETLREVSQKTGTPLSSVYSVATFYSYFSLKPQGEHTVVVCRGTACHTRGSLGLLEEAAARLGAKDFREDEDSTFTTADMRFTLRTVACFGQCALAPIVALDGQIHSHVTPGRLVAAIEALRKGAKA